MVPKCLQKGKKSLNIQFWLWQDPVQLKGAHKVRYNSRKRKLLCEAGKFCKSCYWVVNCI